jgi:hypothetical protein
LTPLPCSEGSFQPSQILTLSVARWFFAEVSTLTEGRFIAPESALKREPPCQSCSRCEPVTATTLTTQSAFDWIDPAPLDTRFTAPVGRVRTTLHGWSTRFTTRVAPPCQGDGTRLTATSSARDERTRLAPPKRMPLSNLCSRRIVIESPPDRPVHELGALTLPTPATCIEPRTRHACTERNTSCPRRRWLAVAGITNLEWRIGLGADCASCGLEGSTASCGMPGFAGHNSRRRYRPLREPSQLDH